MPRLTLRFVLPRALLAFAVGALTAGCTKSLGTLVTETMDSCIALRNPAFTGGKGASALDTPFPAELEAKAKKLAYQRALKNYVAIAESAKNQVTLVCALELAGYYKNGDVGVLLWKYTKHPDAAVAENAKRLLKLQDPLPSTYTQ
jgi:hypothetical protein